MTSRKPDIGENKVCFTDHEGTPQQGSLNKVLSDPERGIKTISDVLAVALLAISQQDDQADK